MDDLRERFAALNDVPMPKLWDEIERRAETLATMAPTGRLAPVRPAWRGTIAGWSPGSARPIGSRRMVALLVAVAITIALIGGAIAVGSGLLRSSLVVPLPSPESPRPTARGAGLIAVLHHASETTADPTDPGYNNFEGQMWIANPDGSNAHKLLPDRPPIQDGMAWSPDGTRLVFSEDGKLYFSNASGSEPQVIDTGCELPCAGDRYPAFSRDGSRLVFNRTNRREPDTSGVFEPPTYVIAAMDLASGRVIELESTAVSYSTNGHGPYGIGYQQSRWSPDGRRIAFSRWNMFYGGSESLFMVDQDGANLHPVSTPGVVARDPDWSPDGGSIVFSSIVFRGASAQGNLEINLDVYTVRPDGGDQRRLTTDGVSSGASWTPDGNIVFTRIPGGSTTAGGAPSRGPLAAEVWLMNADGTHQIKLATLPDAARLLFAEDAAMQPSR